MQTSTTMLVRAIADKCPAFQNDLFEQNLISPHIKSEVGLLIYTNEQMASKMVDCVRSKVEGFPDKIHIFIEVLEKNDEKEAARTLKEKSKAMYHNLTSCP